MSEVRHPRVRCNRCHRHRHRIERSLCLLRGAALHSSWEHRRSSASQHRGRDSYTELHRARRHGDRQMCPTPAEATPVTATSCQPVTSQLEGGFAQLKKFSFDLLHKLFTCWENAALAALVLTMKENNTEIPELRCTVTVNRKACTSGSSPSPQSSAFKDPLHSLHQ